MCIHSHTRERKGRGQLCEKVSKTASCLKQLARAVQTSVVRQESRCFLLAVPHSTTPTHNFPQTAYTYRMMPYPARCREESRHHDTRISIKHHQISQGEVLQIHGQHEDQHARPKHHQEGTNQYCADEAVTACSKEPNICRSCHNLGASVMSMRRGQRGKKRNTSILEEAQKSRV